jgi:hypothetical protein
VDAIPPWQESDHQGEFGKGGGQAGRRPDIGAEVVEASAKVLDEGMPGNDDLAVRSRFSPRMGRSLWGPNIVIPHAAVP